MQEPTRLNFGEGRCRWSSMSESGSIGPAGVMATACRHRRPNATREAPAVIAVGDQLATRERQAGPCGVAEKPVVPTTPGNSGGGKGLQLKANARSNKDGEIGDEPNNSSKRSEVADGANAKAKESPSFRFYALYDKVYREDVLTFAYARCKANGGAAGVDDQSFEDIEAYGAKRWLDELTQALKSRS